MKRNPLFINANNNGYEPSQCGSTLTVGELIEILSYFEEDQPVFLRFDNGYSYGSIEECDLITADELGVFEEDLEEEEDL
jgi:hypothetical protein